MTSCWPVYAISMSRSVVIRVFMLRGILSRGFSGKCGWPSWQWGCRTGLEHPRRLLRRFLSRCACGTSIGTTLSKEAGRMAVHPFALDSQAAMRGPRLRPRTALREDSTNGLSSPQDTQKARSSIARCTDRLANTGRGSFSQVKGLYKSCDYSVQYGVQPILHGGLPSPILNGQIFGFERSQSLLGYL